MIASTNQLGIPPKSLVLSNRLVFLHGACLKANSLPFDFMYSPYGKNSSVVHRVFNTIPTGGVA